MGVFSIPSHYKKGFELLSNIDSDEFQKIINSVREFPLGGGSLKLQSVLEGNGVDQSFILAPTIMSFGSFLKIEENFLYPENVANDLAFDLYGEGGKAKDFSERLQDLFSNCKRIADSFKAQHVQSNNANNFHGSETITDLRPIFGSDLQDRERCFVIKHDLVLRFDSGGRELEEVYISVDRKDLLGLRDTIERALEKERNLVENYSELNIVDFDEYYLD